MGAGKARGARGCVMRCGEAGTEARARRVCESGRGPDWWERGDSMDPRDDAIERAEGLHAETCQVRKVQDEAKAAATMKKKMGTTHE
eukprot:6174625-Pleurochrysis_carterae.AAC.1